MTCIDAEMELGEGFILNNSMLKVLSNCGPEFINELLGEMLLSCNSISRWRFYYQLILYGEVSLDKKYFKPGHFDRLVSEELKL